MDTNMLRGVKLAEDALGKERGGELASLPEGHPLRVAIEDAQRRHEEQIAFEQELKKQEESRQERKAKIQKKKAEAKNKRQAADENARRREAAGEFNASIKKLGENVVSIASMLPEFEKQLSGVPGLSSRMSRLKRMMMAFHHGLMDARISASRFPEVD